MMMMMMTHRWSGGGGVRDAGDKRRVRGGRDGARVFATGHGHQASAGRYGNVGNVAGDARSDDTVLWRHFRRVANRQQRPRQSLAARQARRHQPTILIIIITRLPSSVTLTTQECVNLLTCDHFRSRNKDGSHSIRSSIAEIPMLYTNSMFYRTGVMAAQKFYIVAIGIFSILLLWPWSSFDDLHIQSWPVFPGDMPDMGRWISYVKAFESWIDRYSDGHQLLKK